MPAPHDRLTAIQDRLGKPTPAPLEGQEAIPLDDEAEDGPPLPEPKPLTLW